MPLRNYTKFKNVFNFGDNLLLTELENNLKIFYDWALLGVGAFFNVTVPTSGTFGGTFSALRLVDDPSYTAGQVWETKRKDIVWETGIDYSTQPIAITGVFVDSIGHPSGHNTFGHHINYPLGRVIFGSAISTSSTVTLAYSHRWVQVYRVGDAPWWDEIQYRSFRPDDSHATQTGSGDYAILSNHRVQLPAIVIESVPRRDFQPYELGNGSLIAQQDILFHVLAESRWERNQLVDLISYQDEKDIWLFNSNTVISDNRFPLDFRGQVVDNPIMYPHLVESSSNLKRTTGDLFPATGITETGTGNVDWVNASEISANNDTYATAVLAA